MVKKLPVEFLFQLFALLLGFILVHGAYVTVIRPRADAFLSQEHAKMAADANYEQQQNFYVVLRDYEQETCLILMFWALAILGFKGVNTYRQRRMLDAAIDMLRPGGVLVYCVCSLQPEEGEEQIARLCAERKTQISLQPIRPGELPGLDHALTPEGTLRTLPHFRIGPAHTMDGFYAARLIKSAP